MATNAGRLLKAEALFLLFVLLNMAKLTTFQYFVTWNSGFELYKMVIKNTIFIYFCYRALLLQPLRLLLVISVVLQNLYLAVLFLYYIYSGNIMNLSQLQVIGEGLAAADTLLIVLKDPRILLLLMDLPMLVYLYIHYRRMRKDMRYLSIPAVVLAAIALYLIFKRMDFFRGTGVEWGYIGQNAKFGTIYTSIFLSNSRNEERAVQDLQYGPEQQLPGKEQKVNIITIQVESLNADVVHHRHGGEPVMPYLSRMARQFLYYPRMVVQHRSGGSSDAEFAVFNGAETLYGFPVCQFRTYEYPNSLLHQLQGYTKYAFHGNSGEYFNRNTNLPGMGFDRFFDIYSMGLPQEGWGASDRALFDFALKQMEEIQKPFLFHIITMSSHGPYTLVKQYHEHPLIEEIEEPLERNYLLSMNYVDLQLSQFVEAIRSEAPDTTIFIYGDHSIPLAGRGYKAKSRTVHEGSKFEMVPLIIITPEGKQATLEKAAAMLDLGYTILSAAGVQTSIRSFGDNLLVPQKITTPLRHFGKSFDRTMLGKLPLD